MVGGAIGGAGALVVGPWTGHFLLWPWGLLAFLVATTVGIVLGQLVGGRLFRPSSGDPPKANN